MTGIQHLSCAGDLARLDFAKSGGTVTVVAQDAATGRVLMVAAADRDALERTLSTGEMHFLSRRRGPWRKGETSGDVLRVVRLLADCDGDAVLALVHPANGIACHTGSASCFGDAPVSTLATLDATIAARATVASETSYTSRLLGDRNLRLKKLGEECAELVVACADSGSERVAAEAADVLYHVLVAARSVGVGLGDIERVLAERSLSVTHR
jgi:phosphoribosyl-ATP pyrophosphohydrolase/phosphoribosyl-AMP cyclohydrolase